MADEIMMSAKGLGTMYLVSVLAMVVVIVAMSMDAAFGWRKAKLRGDARTSYLFSRSITKFALYEGVLFICAGMDTLIHFVWAQFNHESHYIAPLASCAMAMVLCIVEIWSMREKADEKTRDNLNNAIKIIAEAAKTKQVGDVLTKVISEEKDEDTQEGE